jgi:hypothetical protein
MFEKKEELKETLEKIAKELEIANKLKIYEIVVSQPHIDFNFLSRFYDKAVELEEEIKAKMKE